MFKSVTIRSISRKRDLPSAWLPTTHYQHRSPRNSDSVRMFSNSSERRAQPDTLDKHDEDVQRILREYGVDPDDVGDAKLEEKKKKKRESKVEDFEAWKEWDGMVDRKEERRLEGVPAISDGGVGIGMENKAGQDEAGKEEDPSSSTIRSTSNSTPSSGSAPLLIRPLPTSPTPNATPSSSAFTAGLTRSQAEKLQARLNDHIKTLRTEADALRKTLSVRTEVLRQRASERAKALEQGARVQFGLLGGRVNELTGYNEVERLKREVTERGEHEKVFPLNERSRVLAYASAACLT